MSQPNTPSDAIAQDQTSTSSSISAAAHAYQIAMQQQSDAPSSAPVAEQSNDVVMAESTPAEVASPAVIPKVEANAPSPIPGRMGTPARTNGNDATSRATSQHPEPASMIPKDSPPNGAPTRQYINSKVTGPLMDGMKLVAKEKPKDPLRMLGEYLLQRSRELEGT
ncbi:related to histone-lysine N-methyltransferase [Phialocephala subalpina]|uniref:Related to histone-lysine N-methyltransferase n=1 Tax=Phialocephala subalpina TaxID=576137 RepID=A0A1L7WCP2_9HELO|nr:related to histone-lysine N-methyltransferase [Phialocephala subalpina]